MSLAVIFGANLRHYRKVRQLTQSELAEKAGLSTEMISKMERGIASPSLATVERLSGILDMPAVAFFGAGAVQMPDSERSRLVLKIHTRLSRLNEDHLARADRLLSVLTD